MRRMPTGNKDVSAAMGDMEKRKVICFKLLGSFSYALLEESDRYSEIGVIRHDQKEYRTVPGKVGKKTLSFLQYLVVNHSRNITAEELIETFWTEKNSNDPANALRNMLFKIRGLLKNMFPEQEELLRTFHGCYGWDTDVEIRLDTEGFEQTCLEGRKYSGEKSMERLRQAFALYSGDFLCGNDSEWAGIQRQYYRTLYLDTCRMLLPIFGSKGRVDGNRQRMQSGVPDRFLHGRIYYIPDAGVYRHGTARAGGGEI